MLAICVMLASLVACEQLRSRASTRPATAALELQSNTFRDLRQHTFSEGSSESALEVDIAGDAETMAYVLYQSNGRSISEDIYVKALNARSRVQKTTNAASDRFPAISPDGTKLAYASRSNGSYDIFVTNLDSSRARRQVTFSEEEEISPTWSRDGNRIAYCRLSRSNYEWEICVTDLNTGSVTTLVAGAFPEYSPTEDLIAFSRLDRQTNRFGLWTIDEAATQETQILSSAQESYIDPTWSPDGRRLAFASYGKAVRASAAWSSVNASSVVDDLIGIRGSDIWTIRVNGTELSQLTTQDDDDWGPCWSTDGRIFFSSRRGDKINIWSVIPEFVRLEAPTEKPEQDGSPGDTGATTNSK